MFHGLTTSKSKNSIQGLFVGKKIYWNLGDGIAIRMGQQHTHVLILCHIKFDQNVRISVSKLGKRAQFFFSPGQILKMDYNGCSHIERVAFATSNANRFFDNHSRCLQRETINQSKLTACFTKNNIFELVCQPTFFLVNLS